MRSDGPPGIPPESIAAKAAWRRAQASRTLEEKVAILLQLQKDELPLLEKQRPLRPWERPWPITP